jgi:hypothetical protein
LLEKTSEVVYRESSLNLTHGWPGSVVEFHKVIEPLTDAEKHGGLIG